MYQVRFRPRTERKLFSPAPDIVVDRQLDVAKYAYEIARVNAPQVRLKPYRKVSIKLPSMDHVFGLGLEIVCQATDDYRIGNVAKR